MDNASIKTLSWHDVLKLEEFPFIIPDETEDMTRLESFPTYGHNDLLDYVLVWAELAAAKGLEVFVLDQTKPDIGLDVVKIIVPGMRTFLDETCAGTSL